MTENECIDVLKNLAFLSTNQEHEKCEESIEMAIKALEEIQQYRAIGTIEEFKALKEKSVAKKPILRSRGVYDEDNEDYLGEEEYMICPSCEIRWEVFRNQTHCRRCNQKLDWND